MVCRENVSLSSVPDASTSPFDDPTEKFRPPGAGDPEWTNRVSSVCD